MDNVHVSDIAEITHFHFCFGLGCAAKGFNDAEPRVGNLRGRFRCLGGVDVDPSAIRNFESIVGTPGTVMDLFTRGQYLAFHGKVPPPEWREVGPADIRAAAGNERPNIVFISSPCKGASGLLSEEKSRTPKYQALNELTLRCVWLMCEAWKDDPVELIGFENVPRLTTRARHLLDQIIQLLQGFGYATNETKHDCGELGGLAQSRKRYLLVGRHQEKVPPFLYEPAKRRLCAVGDLLGRMSFPGDADSGPLHRIPSLQWKTWVRLAFVEAGSDWRSLNKLKVEDGYLSDYVIVPEFDCDDTGALKNHTNDAVVVDDPRPPAGPVFSKYAVTKWDRYAGTVIGGDDQGAYAVADPRSNTGFAGAGKYQITPFNGPTGTVIAGSTSGQGAFAVADPRSAINARVRGDAYLTGGHYGVIRWDEFSGAVSASAGCDNGRWSVADPRTGMVPAQSEKTVAMIRALDGTWHRPFTTLELAALQSLIEPEEHLLLDGMNDSAWREQIGNAVPRKAAQAIGEVFGTTLLLARSGETFVLGSTPIWVRDVALALTMPGPAEAW